MDEFGVLVESIGFRADGRSAPMAKMKPKSNSSFPTRSTANTSSHDDSYSFSVDELDGIFRSDVNINKTIQPESFSGVDDFFNAPISNSTQYGGIDLDAMFNGSSNRSYSSSNFSLGKSEQSFNAYDDFLGFGSTHSDPVDDSFGSFRKSFVEKQGKKDPVLDDLVLGFGGAAPTNVRGSFEKNLNAKSSAKPADSYYTVIDDPFSVFESSGSQTAVSWQFGTSSDKDGRKGSVQYSFDDFSNFVEVGSGSSSGPKLDGINSSTNNSSYGTRSNGFQSANYIDEIFGGGIGNESSKSVRTGEGDKNSLFDDFFHEEKRPDVKQTPTSSLNKKKTISSTHRCNDVNLLFGDITTSSGEFHEIEGEPEERRRARLNRHIRTNERMAEALAEKNQRDLQSQLEQEEKRRLAETLDYDIKRWAAGKEGNLRALLSSLQEVLWAECGWRAVPLTDMITSESVKKVYKKASLYVHPDKVQQKGANLQQRHIAEKVFDLLKEAWNKFSADELG